MKDEFDQIMEYFSHDDREKQENLEEIFSKSSKFLEKFKEIQEKGSEKERDAMRQKMEIIHKKFQEESEKVTEDMGLKAEDIQQLSQDSKNFSESQWAFLQKAKQSLTMQNAEIAKRTRQVQSDRLKKMKSKVNRKAKKKDWMKS